jgi:hypothetical protein
LALNPAQKVALPGPCSGIKRGQSRITFRESLIASPALVT